MIILEKKIKPNHSTFYRIKSDKGFYELHLWHDNVFIPILKGTTTLNYWDESAYYTNEAIQFPPNGRIENYTIIRRANRNINIPSLISIDDNNIEDAINKIHSLAVLI